MRQRSRRTLRRIALVALVLGTLLSLALDQLRDQDPGWRQTAQLVQFAGSLVAGLVFIVSWEAR